MDMMLGPWNTTPQPPSPSLCCSSTVNHRRTPHAPSPWIALRGSDGSRYDGEWSNGRKEGKGTLHFANGDSFTGYWSAGVISGPGVLALHDESPWNVADL